MSILRSRARTGEGPPSAQSPLEVRPGSRSGNVFAFFVLGLLALAMTGAPAHAAESPAALDLNSATAIQLEALPGIGEVKAAAILAVRAERGGFKSVEELESVRGIGPALVAKLRPMVQVGPRKGAKPQAAASTTRAARVAPSAAGSGGAR